MSVAELYACSQLTHFTELYVIHKETITPVEEKRSKKRARAVPYNLEYTYKLLPVKWCFGISVFHINTGSS